MPLLALLEESLDRSSDVAAAADAAAGAPCAGGTSEERRELGAEPPRLPGAAGLAATTGVPARCPGVGEPVREPARDDGAATGSPPAVVEPEADACTCACDPPNAARSGVIRDEKKLPLLASGAAAAAPPAGVLAPPLLDALAGGAAAAESTGSCRELAGLLPPPLLVPLLPTLSRSPALLLAVASELAVPPEERGSRVSSALAGAAASAATAVVAVAASAEGAAAWSDADTATCAAAAASE